MYQKVGGEGGTSLETFPALLALEQLLGAVNGSVLVQTDLVAEGFVAELTGERSGSKYETNFFYFH